MLFNSFEFLFFFIIIYLFYINSNHKIQNRLLLIGSYIFYGSWDWRFLSLILTSTIIDYYCGISIEKSTTDRVRKRFLVISLVTNLGLLGFFKYFDFFSENFVSILESVNITANFVTLNIVLPVGISFYTFQTLSYTIDVFRNNLKAETNFFDFALFVSFFPQLVAGPIERASNLLPQIQNKRTITKKQLKEGLWYCYFGYFLKVFIADNMAHFADATFAEIIPISGFEVLLGTYAFAFQIFGDFAGYSFIAIGVSKFLGFNLMTNFLYPYFVINPSSFWRNWHISLSSWLRDYLYIPLGGNKSGSKRTYINLTITMLLGGLWHGAAWTYIIWGAYQGIVLIVFRLFKNFILKFPLKIHANKITYILKVILMFHVTCIGWLIFRSESVIQLNNYITSFFTNFGYFTERIEYFIYNIFFYSFLLLIIQIIQKKNNSLLAIINLKGYRSILFYVAMFYLIILFGEFNGKQFIYFQF